MSTHRLQVGDAVVHRTYGAAKITEVDSSPRQVGAKIHITETGDVRSVLVAHLVKDLPPPPAPTSLALVTSR